jgi:hypothetical protein
MADHPDDDALLEHLQRTAFDYFVQNANARNGLIADTTRAGSPSSIAVVGYVLSAYPVRTRRDPRKAGRRRPAKSPRPRSGFARPRPATSWARCWSWMGA